MTNEINNAQDIIDSRDIIARIEDLESECIQYTAGWNMTGRLCDLDPGGFVDFDDAKQYILDTLQSEIDRLGDNSWIDDPDEREEAERAADEVESIIQDINLESGPFSVFVEPLNEWYWVADNPDDLMPEDEDDAAELRALRELAEQCEGYGDWEHGEVLVRDSYFVEYTQELAEDIGAVNSDIGWPGNCIDWDEAADELKQDYMSVEFDGVDYWMRA